MRVNYATALRLQVQRDPGRPAITFGGQALTRVELDEQVDRLAAGLRDLGVGQGDFIAFTGKNHPDLVALAFAAWRLGAAPFAIPWQRTAEEMSGLLALSRPRIAVDFPDGVSWTGLQITTADLEELAPGAVPVSDATSPVLRIGASGGSTGRSKVIVLEQVAEIDPDQPGLIGMKPNGTDVVALSITDGGGFMATMMAIAIGSHIILMPEFDAMECVRLVEVHKATWMGVTQPIMLAIRKLGDDVVGRRLDGLAVSNFSGGVADWLKRWWVDRLGPENVMWTYGGTDARGSVVGDGVVWRDRPGVAGHPPASCEVSIRDGNGANLPAGEVGRIYLRDLTGRRNFRYLGAAMPASIDGFECIGDLGWLDLDGFLFVADREADVIRTPNGRVYPLTVEAELERHPLVRSAVVVGSPAGVHAVVDCPASRPDSADLLAGLQVAQHERPSAVTFVDEPLRDLAGKANRFVWRGILAAAGADRAGSPLPVTGARLPVTIESRSRCDPCAPACDD